MQNVSGLQPIVVENFLEGDELRTDVLEIEKQITSLGPESVVAVMTTTSCFAPRAVDKLEEVHFCFISGYTRNTNFIFQQSQHPPGKH